MYCKTRPNVKVGAREAVFCDKKNFYCTFEKTNFKKCNLP